MQQSFTGRDVCLADVHAAARCQQGGEVHGLLLVHAAAADVWSTAVCNVHTAPAADVTRLQITCSKHPSRRWVWILDRSNNEYVVYIKRTQAKGRQCRTIRCTARCSQKTGKGVRKAPLANFSISILSSTRNSSTSSSSSSRSVTADSSKAAEVQSGVRFK